MTIPHIPTPTASITALRTRRHSVVRARQGLQDRRSVADTAAAALAAVAPLAVAAQPRADVRSADANKFHSNVFTESYEYDYEENVSIGSFDLRGHAGSGTG